MAKANFQLQLKLKEKYNPEGSVLREQQHRMLYILDKVAEICERNSISYWLTGGTLLGAARHSGFIPWDDDVDICIFRKDLKKFRKMMISELPEDLVLQCHKTDPNYYHPYLKIRDLNSLMKETGNEDINYIHKGIYIDVFPVERGHMKLIRYTYLIWGRILYGYILSKHLTSFRKIICRFLYFLFSLIFGICRLIDRVFLSKIWTFPYGCYFPQAPGHKDNDILPIIKTEEASFEGRLYYCPHDIHSYLTKCYGNYLQIPNDEEIEPHITEIKIWAKDDKKE